MNSPSQNLPVQLSCEQLLGALDTEINYSAERQRGEGWTKWAVWGALAALVWLAIGLWVEKDLALARAAHLFILAFVIWKLLEEIVRNLVPSARLEIGPPRFRLAEDTIHPLRPDVAVTAVQYLVVLGVLYYFAVPGQRFLWLYGLGAVAITLFMFGTGRFILGVPEFISLQNAMNVTTGLQLACLSIAGWQISSLIRVNLSAYVANELRLAFVLIAAAFLISRLLTSTSSQYLVDKLTQLRQHIAFGRIPLAEANQRAADLLTGVTLTQLLKPLVERIFAGEANLQSLLAAAHKTLDGAQADLLAPASQPQRALRTMDELVQCPLSPFNYFVQAFAGAFDLRQDFFAGGFPDVALGREITVAEITEDCIFEFLHAAETAGQNHILTQVSEEALHQV